MKNIEKMVNKQKVIWVFGISGSGKATLLKKFKNKKLKLDKFEISNELKICEASLVCGKTKSGKTRHRDQQKMEEEIGEIIKEGKSVIVKVQFNDVEKGINIPQKIKDIFPSLEHEAWMLGISYEEMKKRWDDRRRNNPTWKDESNTDNYEKATKRMKKDIEDIGEGFIKKYFCSDNYEYISINSHDMDAIFKEKSKNQDMS